MDFSLSDDLVELKERTERLVRERIIPYENDPRQSPHGPSPELRRELVALGRDAGLLSPHVGREWGGLGLDHRAKSVVFEAAGYSPLGPVALNCFAPDEANMHLLEQVAEEHQKERWLRPLAAGEIRSCFMMTEPAPGAGSDPSMLNTTARRATDGNRGDFVIDGDKWLITGAVGAEFAIVMAKTDSDGAGPAGATMFLTPMDTPGDRRRARARHARPIHVRRPCGNPARRVAGCRKARCSAGSARAFAMPRYGWRRRGLPIACAGLAPPVAPTTSPPIMPAAAPPSASHWASMRESASCSPTTKWICTRARLVIWHAAWVLDQGGRGGHESSMAKVICSEAIWRVVDRSMQILGGLGITDDTIVARLWREVRPFRIYDGPSEVHRWSIARRVLRTDGGA